MVGDVPVGFASAFSIEAWSLGQQLDEMRRDGTPRGARDVDGCGDAFRRLPFRVQIESHLSATTRRALPRLLRRWPRLHAPYSAHLHAETRAMRGGPGLCPARSLYGGAERRHRIVPDAVIEANEPRRLRAFFALVSRPDGTAERRKVRFEVRSVVDGSLQRSADARMTSQRPAVPSGSR